MVSGAPRISRVEKSLNLLLFSTAIDLLGKEFRFTFDSPFGVRVCQLEVRLGRENEERTSHACFERAKHVMSLFHGTRRWKSNNNVDTLTRGKWVGKTFPSGSTA